VRYGAVILVFELLLVLKDAVEVGGKELITAPNANLNRSCTDTVVCDDKGEFIEE